MFIPPVNSKVERINSSKVYCKLEKKQERKAKKESINSSKVYCK